jgi:cytochrome c oxidase subunit II
MTSVIIASSLILTVAVLVLLFRIQTLVSVLKGSHDTVGTSNKVNGALMIIVPLALLLAVVWYHPYAAKEYHLPVASMHGVWTDNLFWTTLGIVVAMFLITNIALFYCAFAYQYDPNRKASYYHDNPKVEIAWTIAPAIIMTVLVIMGYLVWHDTVEKPYDKDAEVIEIMGKQFAWQVRYPGKDGALGKYDFRLIDDAKGNEFGINFEDNNANDDFLARELRIPKGKPVRLKIRARDVLHSVYMPHFRVKMDAVPGMPTEFVFTPTKTTEEMRTETGNAKFNYELACTEICGKGHFAMKYIIIVEEQEDYKKWYASQKTFLEEKPEFKGKGMNSLKKKNLANQEKEQKEKASKQQASL